jgi:hypothetical protein
MTKKTIVLGLFLFLSTGVRAIEIVTISAAITLAKLSWDVSKAAYNHFYPSQAELNSAEVNAHEAAVITAQKIFFACLERNADARKDKHGFADRCKVEKENYKRIAGLLKYKQVRNAFREIK